jgi:tetrahydromethanopterin S-methyltransferase subunit D
MMGTEEWRLQYEQDTPGAKGWLLPPVVCGAASGLIPGLLVGGIGGALFFALLGAGTAAGFTWWTIRDRWAARAGLPSTPRRVQIGKTGGR